MADPIAGSIRPFNEAAMLASSNRWRRYLGALLCVAVSGVFLYLAARKADFFEVHRALAAIDLRWLVPIIVISLAISGCVPSGGLGCFHRSPGRQCGSAFSAFMIGALTNNFVPGRLGDVARAGMIGRLVPAIGSSGAFATVVLEKVVDGLMLLALLGVAFLVAPLPVWLAKTGVIGSLVFLGSLLLLLSSQCSWQSEQNEVR